MERPRCPTHGLVIGDAGCLRCLGETHAREATKKRQPLVAVFAISIGLIVLAMLAFRAMLVVKDVQAAQSTPVSVEPATAGAARRAPITPKERAATGAAAATAVAALDPNDRGRLAAEMKSVPVTLYSANYCPWCKKAKEHLASRGIAYDERHIDEDPSAKREMARIGGKGIPTFDIEGDVASGYDPAWVEQTLELHAARRIAATR